MTWTFLPPFLSSSPPFWLGKTGKPSVLPNKIE